ncbi:MFS transporter [Fibrobacter sp.]|uniref:MFS transporter n=1 Tax=Fibrobacter sp. TaxID=35828 RepID=UPI0025C382E7|nr:MFS transporter [Fibrobacter sp.]MBR3073332.1 MFS transporter [Fibrobacter sp.]
MLIVIYVAFIGLGLPDTILGAAWPLMQQDLNTPISAAGILSIIVSIGTIISSLLTPKFLRILGTGKLVAYSIALTAIASIGYGFADSFNILCLWAIPMGIGAGAVDVAMNNFAAVYLESKHTNWLHASWGIGATLGPSLLSFSIMTSNGWRGAYEMVAILLAIIFTMILISLPLWKKQEANGGVSGATNLETATHDSKANNSAQLSFREALRVPGMKLSFFTFFFYSALEISTSLWCGTYLTACGFKPEVGAMVVSLMFASVMIGRIISGFFAIKFTDHRLIYAGIFIVAAGCLVLSLPLPLWMLPVCICLLGLGCAPVYPSLIHATPARFGEALSSRAISIQLAGSYVGSIIMPPAFGLVATKFSVHLWPISLSIFVGLLLLCVLLLDFVTHRKLNKSYARERVLDILHEVSMESVKRERLKRKRKKKR